MCDSKLFQNKIKRLFLYTIQLENAQNFQQYTFYFNKESIDGTLTEPGHNEPPESAIQAIHQARKRGHYVFLCTGRNYDMLSPLLKYDFDGIIASSGGYIECQKEVIYDCPMTEEQKQTAMNILKENGIFRTVECMDGSYTD